MNKMVPLRLARTPEFGIKVNAKLKKRSRESKRVKIVHVEAVRPGAYDPRDIRASVV
ncbi:hypothetical protein CsatA_016100 [Cannabis sativa]